MIELIPLVAREDLDALDGASCYRLSRPDRDSRIGPDLWHPTGKSDWKTGAAQEAVQVCRECNVRWECLQIGLRRDDETGIWGGFELGDPEQRRRAKNVLKRRAS